MTSGTAVVLLLAGIAVYNGNSTVTAMVVLFLPFWAITRLGRHAPRGESIKHLGPMVLNVYDGDTFTLATGEKIRILGIDCPEMNGPNTIRAHVARDRLRELISGKRVEIWRKGRDKYGRTLAWVLVDGKNVADTLLQEGLARAYNGGRREEW